MRIIFVCTGNTCRSSMAEGIAKAVLAEKKPDAAVDILSAGTCAFPNAPAAWQAVETMKQKDIDIQHHRAAQLTKELVDQADLILTMTASHRRQVLNLAPDAEDKVFTLSEYAGGGGDIPDPVGQPVEVYQACAARLEELIKKALDKILQQYEGNNRSV